MLYAQLLRLPRRMQWVRHQYQPGHQPSLLRAKHRSLSPAIRMPTQKHPPRGHSRRACREPPHGLNRVLEPGAIPSGIPRPRRPTRANLPVRQIAAQHHHASRSHRLCNRDEQWRIGVRSRAMREYQPTAISGSRPVQETANRRLASDCEPFKSTIRGSHGLESTTARGGRTMWGRPPSAVHAERSGGRQQAQPRRPLQMPGNLLRPAAGALAVSLLRRSRLAFSLGLT